MPSEGAPLHFNYGPANHCCLTSSSCELATQPLSANHHYILCRSILEEFFLPCHCIQPRLALPPLLVSQAMQLGMQLLGSAFGGGGGAGGKGGGGGQGYQQQGGCYFDGQLAVAETSFNSH